MLATLHLELTTLLVLQGLRTPLMLATLHLELTTLLVLQGLRTPLMLATLHARDDIVRYLLLTEICDLNLQDCVSPKLIY